MMVAFGMVGASFSGISFVSVPGMVLAQDMTYLQTCLGFILGYFIVAFVLLPVYYRLNLTSIYTFLQQRFGNTTYRTGAGFFLLSDMCGSALKFYVACIVLQRFAMDHIGVPFYVTVPLLVLLIWAYSHRFGVKALVRTDVFQTLIIILSLALIIYNVVNAMNLTPTSALRFIGQSPHGRVFEFSDFLSSQNFFKQFISGAFIVVVMTGLNQNMMQKNLTCRSLHEAQKNMCLTGFSFVPVNFLFLALGILLIGYYQQLGQPLPARADDLLTTIVSGGSLGQIVAVLFVVGVFASSTSTADSSLTALTTSFCVDIMQRPESVSLRKRVHLLMSAVFVLFILGFHALNDTSLINAVYTLVSYTYGPLLGLYALGLFTHRRISDRRSPIACIAAPLLTLIVDTLSGSCFGYHFGYELLIANALITIVLSEILTFTDKGIRN